MRELSDDQLLRYARNILLPSVDVEGQARLLETSVTVVGVGGLGAPLLQYLAATGVGRIRLIDDDVVDATNLQRQVLFRPDDVGRPKVQAACDALASLNPDVTLEPIHARLDDNLLTGLKPEGVWAVGTDNFQSRALVNRFCREHELSWVAGAAIGTSGQLTSFVNASIDEPCYQCVYENLDDGELSCATAGVLGPVVGTIGAQMALEVIKLALSIGKPLVGRLQVWDALAMEWQTFQYQKNPKCRACSLEI